MHGAYEQLVNAGDSNKASEAREDSSSDDNFYHLLPNKNGAPCPEGDRPPGGNARPPCDHNPRAEPTSLGVVDWVKRLVSGLGDIAKTIAFNSDLLNELF